MNVVKRTTGGVGKVFLALLGGILFPVLIWVAVGAAISQRLRGRSLKPAPAPTPGKTLAAADLDGVPAREAAPKHCWEILQCTPEQREACPSYARRDMPGWVAAGLGKGVRSNERVPAIRLSA